MTTLTVFSINVHAHLIFFLSILISKGEIHETLQICKSLTKRQIQCFNNVGCHGFEFATPYRALPSFVNDPLTNQRKFEQDRFQNFKKIHLLYLHCRTHFTKVTLAKTLYNNAYYHMLKETPQLRKHPVFKIIRYYTSSYETLTNNFVTSLSRINVFRVSLMQYILLQFYKIHVSAVIFLKTDVSFVMKRFLK
jgi:hypothetical protein